MKESDAFSYVILVLIASAVLFCGCDKYSVTGRNIHCFQAMQYEDTIYYKDEIKLSDGEWRNCGLYYKTLNGNKSGALCDNFFSCPNYYNNGIYYIDMDLNISIVDLENLSRKVYIDSQEDIENLLIIGGDLYYATSSGSNSLHCVNVENGNDVCLINNIEWRYLYNYGNRVVVISTDNNRYVSFDQGKDQQDEGNAMIQVVDFYDNGSKLVIEDGQLVLENKPTKDKEIILSGEKTVSIISDRDCIAITLENSTGLYEVYIYDISSKELKYAGSPDYMPRLFFNDHSGLICFKESCEQEVQLLNVETHERSIFAMN